MKTSKLTLYIFIGLLAGVVVGWKFPQLGIKMQPLATIFLNMIKMIIAPLLFSVVVTGIASHGDIKSLGKLGAKTFIYFATATSFALIIGLSIGLISKPGAGFAIENVSQKMMDKCLSAIIQEFSLATQRAIEIVRKLVDNISESDKARFIESYTKNLYRFLWQGMI